MKCEKCGKNEATCFYKENINGQIREQHLCAECASEEGILSPFTRRPSDLFDLFFSSFALPGRWEESFFRPALSLQRQRAVGEGQCGGQNACTGASSTASASGVDAQLRQRRERNMLRTQLEEAVAREDYETAITLRDQLRAMDKGEGQ